MKTWQIGRLLLENLSVGVYGIPNATTRFGIPYREGTMFQNRETRDLYISKVNSAPYHNIEILLAEDKLVLVGGGSGGGTGSDVISGIISGTVDTETTIIFSEAFENTNYALAISCYDAGGLMVGFYRTEKTTGGLKSYHQQIVQSNI